MFFAKQAQYRVQNRYQDSGWEPIGGQLYEADGLGDAIRAAEERSRDAVIWGMCRVVEINSNLVIVEFPAGHPPYRVTVADGRVAFVENGSPPIDILADVRVWTDISSSSLAPQGLDSTPVTAPGPDLPPIDIRAPRNIRLRDKENEVD